MQQISEQELQSLRHLVGAGFAGSKKLDAFAGQCQDPQLKQALQAESQKCQQKAMRLMTFLQ